MKTTYLVSAVVLAASAWGSSTVNPLNVKTGLWETTQQHQMTGDVAIPPEMASQLSPDQRAKIEAALKAQTEGGPKTVVTRSCLTQEKLNEPLDLTKQGDECTHSVVTSNSTKQEIRFQCNIGGGEQSGTVTVQAANSEYIKGTIQISMAVGDRTSKSVSEFTSKWLRGTCSDKDEQ